ncbi:copper resistance protein CopD [Mycolicibacterium wolinskyi]|uniref:Copper resistance protein CopD n=2 Tax=Mycolicibacterium wolinskyi TaxID=59750 RepID=A0A132PGZ9_9MYCO|nr:CopD family protein [Mycolicibacterium wolinskyi]KWX21272.1 copper resistance protein CopD [Mycolicibacterium wolinskyi]
MTWRAAAGAALVLAAASAAAAALSYPQNQLAGALVRTVADCAAVVTVGLAAVPMLESARYRAELARTAARPLAFSSAVWLLAELVRLIVVAAQAAAVPVQRVGVHTVGEFALHTTVGRSGLVAIVAALAVCVTTLLAPRTAAAIVATIGTAAAGVAARTLAGHLAESPVGGLAVAVHALAAAVWCGVLAALVLTVTHRGQWARVLPRFSQLSLGSVAVLLLAGVLGAVIRLQAPAELWTTGYGRLLAAKVVVTVGLLVLAWRNRAGWLPAARAHRTSASLSTNRSLAELAVMAVAVTFAAALAVTG